MVLENVCPESNRCLSGLRGRSEAMLLKMRPNAKMREDIQASASLACKRCIWTRKDDVKGAKIRKMRGNTNKGVR